MMFQNPSIYSYIKSEEANFETEEIKVGDNWNWNFRNHVQLIFHLKNGIYFTGENDYTRCFKQIMKPIIGLCNWTEDIEVKDIVFFIEMQNGRALSFLLKKYHDEVYTRKHDVDALLDEITDSDNSYGGTIIQKGKEMPEVLQLNSVAFCDQTDVLGGPIGFKMHFTPDKLRSMSKFGWGKETNGATISLEDLCMLATFEKDPDGTMQGKTNNVPGKTIEVYIVRGGMPEAYLKDNNNMEDYYNQLQIVAFYVDKDSKKNGVTLYRKKEEEGAIKFFSSAKIYGRALGGGTGEDLLHPQVWSNFLEIHKHNMIEAASKIPLVTDDASYTNKNKIQDMENLEITTIEEGKTIQQVPTAAPANIQILQNAVDVWYQQAQLSGSAYDPLMGKEATSGTTFRGQERVVAQGDGLHKNRRGKRAKWVEEIYRDSIIPDMVKGITEGKEFLATLTTEEIMWVADQIATMKANEKIFEMVNKGKMVTKQEQDMLTQLYKDQFAKKGNKQLIKILKDEFKDIGEKIGISIAAKQKDLSGLSDKVLSIFQFIMQNPQGFFQLMQVPAMAKSFENILEFSGLSIGDFSSLIQSQPQLQQPQQETQAPTELALNAPQPTQ